MKGSQSSHYLMPLEKIYYRNAALRSLTVALPCLVQLLHVVCTGMCCGLFK